MRPKVALDMEHLVQYYYGYSPPVWIITYQACHVVVGAGPDRFPNICTKDIRCTTLPECPVCDRRPCSTSLMPFFRSRDFCHIVHVPPYQLHCIVTCQFKCNQRDHRFSTDTYLKTHREVTLEICALSLPSDSSHF